MDCVAVQPACLLGYGERPFYRPWLVIDQGRLQYLGEEIPPRYQSIAKAKLENGVIIPGLCNAHCHLEFSDLHQPIPFQDSFVGWIRDVVQHRAAMNRERATGDTTVPSSAKRDAFQSGFLEAYGSGTKWIVDTVTSPWSEEWVSFANEEIFRSFATRERPWFRSIAGESPMRYLPCAEVLDIHQQRGEETWGFATSRIAATESVSQPKGNVKDYSPWMFTIANAISPHSPYTTSLAMVDRAVRWAQERHGVVSMHLAESLEEMEWIRHRSGPMDVALRSFRDEAFFHASNSMRQLLDSLLQSPHLLLAHGNHFTDEELVTLALHRQHAAIVHCPRTFRHFHPDSRERYPIVDRLAAGVSHLIGTDSRASTPSLELWEDLKYLHTESQLDPETLLSLVTSEAGRVLGEPQMGKIEVGRQVSLSWVSFEAGTSVEAWRAKLFSKSTRCSPLELALERSDFESL